MVEVRDDNTIEIPELKWNQEAFQNHAYDKQRDILFIRQEPKRAGISLDIGGHLWVRFDPESGDVIGIEIEDFERVFLAKYPEMKLGWDQLKPRITKIKKPDKSKVIEYLHLLLMFVRDMVNYHPHQTELPPVR